MKNHKCLKETTDSRTYDRIRRRLYADCDRCRWHGCFHNWCDEHRIKLFFYQEWKKDIPERSKYHHFPSWKLVSKNKKQWMKKRFLQDKRNYANGCFTIYFGW